MKRLTLVLLFILLSVFSFAQKNYPVLELENCSAVKLVSEGKNTFMFSIESINDVQTFIARDLSKNKLEKTVPNFLSGKNVTHILVDGKTYSIYFITAKEDEETREKLFSSIYKYSYKKEKLEVVYTEKEKLSPPRSVLFTGGKLLFIGKDFGKRNKLFSLDNKSFQDLFNSDNYRLLCTSSSPAGFILVNLQNGSEDKISVHFMDLEQKISEEIGHYDSRMVFSTNTDENKTPGLTIINSDYKWAENSFNYSGFPLTAFMIGSRKIIAENYTKLYNHYETSAILDANSNFMITKSKQGICVFNTKNPITEKPQNISEEDLEKIKTDLISRISFKSNKIKSSAINKVFISKFYRVTESVKLDESSTSKSFFIVSKLGNEFEILSDKNTIEKFINKDFKISDEQSAAIFQDALNALYPPGTFEKDDINFYSKNNKWFFIRDESFGEFKGFVVSVNKDKTIDKIKFQHKIGEK